MRATKSRSTHESDHETVSSSSRRTVLETTAKVGGLSLAVLAPTFEAGRARGGTQDEEASGSDILETMVRMERLQVAVYAELDEAIEDGEIDQFGTTDDLSRLIDVVNDIEAHEQAHLERLESALEDSEGALPEDEPFAFSSDDVSGLVGTAETIEETAVGLYAGTVTEIDDQELASTVAAIYGVEARHAGALKTVDELDPFDDAFEAPISIDEAESFIDRFVGD